MKRRLAEGPGKNLELQGTKAETFYDHSRHFNPEGHELIQNIVQAHTDQLGEASEQPKLDV